jgi:hypothetical protein
MGTVEQWAEGEEKVMWGKEEPLIHEGSSVGGFILYIYIWEWLAWFVS